MYSLFSNELAGIVVRGASYTNRFQSVLIFRGSDEQTPSFAGEEVGKGVEVQWERLPLHQEKATAFMRRLIAVDASEDISEDKATHMKRRENNDATIWFCPNVAFRSAGNVLFPRFKLFLHGFSHIG